LLHLDGSRHQWLALVPEQWLTLLAVVDDATTQVLYAQLSERGESTVTVMTALRTVLTTWGLPGALYTDRAHWAAHTPVAGGAVDRTKLSQVGRALAQLGHRAHPRLLAPGPRPQRADERHPPGPARQRAARRAHHHRRRGQSLSAGALPARLQCEFGRAPAEPAPAFVPLGGVDLEQILCHQDERVVARDNTVVLDGIVLQLAKQPGRRSCAELRVLVRRHLDGHHSVWHGARRLGLFDARRAASSHRRPRESENRAFWARGR